MTTWFVTRHHGAVFWAAEYGVKVNEDDDKNGRIVADLDVSRVKKGDEVIGTLPIHMAAAVIKRGAIYTHLSMEIPAFLRGKELTNGQMRECGARLERFDVKSLGRLTKGGSPDKTAVMVAIASGQILQNVLPLLAMEPLPIHLYLLVSGSAEAAASAAKLETFCRKRAIQISIVSDMPDSPLGDIERFVEEKCVAKIIARYPKARIILNATGGTKMMSSGAAAVIERLGEVIYCDTLNQRIEFFAPRHKPAFALPPNVLSLDDYFSSQGVRTLKNKRASRNRRYQESVVSLEATTRRIVELLGGRTGAQIQPSIARINFAASKVYEKKRNGQETWVPVQQIDPIDERLIAILEQAGFGVRFDAGKLFFPAAMTPASKAAVEYVTGGWLEHYCFLVMRDIGLDQRYWDCNIEIDRAHAPHATMNDGTEVSLNEVDLVVAWRNRILIVECKTGSQLQDKSQEITAKLKAIRDYAGGSMADAMVLSSNGFTKPLLERNAREREQLLGIKLHTREALLKFPQLILDWLGRDFVKASAAAASAVPQAQPSSPKADAVKAVTQKTADLPAAPKAARAEQSTESRGRRQQPRKAPHNNAVGKALKKAASNS